MSKDMTVSHSQISMGIDTVSGLTKLREGYSRLIKNLNLNSAGWLEKRKGFQVRSGIIPMKVYSTKYDSTQDITEILFDPTIKLSNVSTSPITITSKDLKQNIYVDEFRWEVISNKILNKQFSSVDTLTTSTAFANYVVRDGSDVRQMNGGYLSYLREGGNPTEITYDFTTYFDQFAEGSEDSLTIVPIELSAPTGDGVSFRPSNAEGVDELPSDTQDKVFDTSIDGFETNVLVPNTWEITTPSSASGDYEQNSNGRIVYNPSDDTITFNLSTSSIGFSNVFLVTQVFDKDLGLVYPHKTIAKTNGDLEITLLKDGRDVDAVIGATTIFARQTSSENYIIRVSNGGTVEEPLEYVLENITNEFTIYKVYAKVGDDYVEVIPDAVIHDTTLNQTTVKVVSPEINTLLIVWENAETPLNRIQVDGEVDELASYGHVYGIPHKDNYIASVPFGGRVAGLINRSDVGKQELIASLGGNFYKDVEGFNTPIYNTNPFYTGTPANIKRNTDNFDKFKTEDYYLPSPVIRGTLQGSGTEENYYGKRLVSDLSDFDITTGRGFAIQRDGFLIVDDEGYATVPSSDFVYNSINKTLTIDLNDPKFNLLRLAEDAEFYSDYFIEQDLIEIKGTGNIYLDKVHSVASVHNSGTILSIKLDAIPSNFTLDGVDQIIFGCFTTDMRVTSNSFSVGDELDQKLFLVDEPVKVSSIYQKNGDTYVVFSGATVARIIPKGITLAGTAITDVLTFDTIYNVVYSDIISIGDNNCFYKIKNIQNINIDEDGNPEQVKVYLDSVVEVTDPVIKRLQVFKIGRWNPILGPEDTLEDYQLLDQYEFSKQEPINMEITKDIILVDNYTNTTKKYDGDKIYQAGLPNWRPIYNVYEDYNSNNKIEVQKIDGQKIKIETTSDVSGFPNLGEGIIFRSYNLSLDGEVSWDSYVGRELGFYRYYAVDAGGDPVENIEDVSEYNTVRTKKVLTSVSSVVNPLIDSGGKPYVELQFKDLNFDMLIFDFGLTLSDAGVYDFNPVLGESYIGIPQTYNYMARLYSTDNQGNKIISRNCGFGDYEISQVFDSSIAVQLKVPDELLNKRNNGNWEIELVRTKADSPSVYYFITARKLENESSDRIMIYDAQSDAALLQGDLDSLSGFVSQGDTLATEIDGPTKALYTTTSSNRYIQANIQSEELADLSIITELTDKNFSYSEPVNNLFDPEETLFYRYNSRINGSQIKIKGQTYLDSANELRDVEYTIVNEMCRQNSDNNYIDIGNAKLLDQVETGTIRLELLPEYVNHMLGDIPDLSAVVGCTIHYPKFDNKFVANFSPKFDSRYGSIQGTSPAVVFYDDTLEIYILEAEVEEGFEYPNMTIANYVDHIFNITLHTLVPQGSIDEYTIRVPSYPAMFVRDSVSGIAYLGQLFDNKSPKYKNSLGQLVGSQLTDVQEYLYHMQEVLDRLGRFQSPDNLYDVFPFYTNRSATDKFKIQLSPKSDEIFGYSFQWKSGTQAVLAYDGLIVDSDTLSDSYEFKKKVFPSRVVLSAENYPEVFDNPFVENTTDLSGVLGSLSAIDVNADDGQEITGIQSFLSESLFSAANLDSILLVFKTTSVYALDLESKRVSKIETSGVGCSIPNSIQATSAGITFANEDGIYIITRNLSMEYLGRPMEGIWRSEVDFSKISEISSFNNTKKREFYINVPTLSGQTYTLSYDYALNGVGQQVSQQGWTILDGFDPSVWTRTNANFYYGAFDGTVMEDRDTGHASDYRDDEEGITAVLEYAPISFGDSAKKAELSKVISHFDYQTDITNCNVSVSTETSREFLHCGTINIKDNGKRTRSIKVRPVDSDALFFQVRWEHSTKDETFKLTGIDYRATESSDEVWEEADD